MTFRRNKNRCRKGTERGNTANEKTGDNTSTGTVRVAGGYGEGTAWVQGEYGVGTVRVLDSHNNHIRIT